LSKVFYRPVSYVTASLAAKCGIQANTVSYWSYLVAVIGCVCYLFNSYTWNIVGAAFINLWLVFDCTDGNLARAVRKQPFGEFADALGSYLQVGLMGACIGVAAYNQGGVIIPQGCVWVVLLGALASSADSLMRLAFQKYKAVERTMCDMGVIEEVKDEKRNDASSLRVRIENELGIGGILPFAILLATIFRALDLIIIYMFCYYGLSFLVAVSLLVKRAIDNGRGKTL